MLLLPTCGSHRDGHLSSDLLCKQKHSQKLAKRKASAKGSWSPWPAGISEMHLKALAILSSADDSISQLAPCSVTSCESLSLSLTPQLALLTAAWRTMCAAPPGWHLLSLVFPEHLLPSVLAPFPGGQILQGRLKRWEGELCSRAGTAGGLFYRETAQDTAKGKPRTWECPTQPLCMSK